MTDIIGVLTVKEVTVIGLLLIACFYLVKSNQSLLQKIDEEHRKIDEEHKRTDLKRDEEMKRILGDCKEMKEERKVERKEWLTALEGNTKELGNIAQKLEVIPKLNCDIENMKTKLTEIEIRMGTNRSGGIQQ